MNLTMTLKAQPLNSKPIFFLISHIMMGLNRLFLFTNIAVFRSNYFLLLDFRKKISACGDAIRVQLGMKLTNQSQWDG